MEQIGLAIDMLNLKCWRAWITNTKKPMVVLVTASNFYFFIRLIGSYAYLASHVFSSNAMIGGSKMHKRLNTVLLVVSTHFRRVRVVEPFHLHLSPGCPCHWILSPLHHPPEPLHLHDIGPWNPRVVGRHPPFLDPKKTYRHPVIPPEVRYLDLKKHIPKHRSLGGMTTGCLGKVTCQKTNKWQNGKIQDVY